MYICLCNAITDHDVRTHAAGEGCSVAMVYRALGAKLQCGKCVPYVREMLRPAPEASHPHSGQAAPG
ncbi:MAG TPA: (2Fe-2S)-binding protein [Stellaceae bacterium]|nr:(2Fe-2S)-binding protein [Stellaceae bacterium]